MKKILASLPGAFLFLLVAFNAPVFAEPQQPQGPDSVPVNGVGAEIMRSLIGPYGDDYDENEVHVLARIENLTDQTVDAVLHVTVNGESVTKNATVKSQDDKIVNIKDWFPGLNALDAQDVVEYTVCVLDVCRPVESRILTDYRETGVDGRQISVYVHTDVCKYDTKANDDPHHVGTRVRDNKVVADGILPAGTWWHELHDGNWIDAKPVSWEGWEEGEFVVVKVDYTWDGYEPSTDYVVLDQCFAPEQPKHDLSATIKTDCTSWNVEAVASEGAVLTYSPVQTGDWSQGASVTVTVTATWPDGTVKTAQVTGNKPNGCIVFLPWVSNPPAVEHDLSATILADCDGWIVNAVASEGAILTYSPVNIGDWSQGTSVTVTVTATWPDGTVKTVQVTGNKPEDCEKSEKWLYVACWEDPHCWSGSYPANTEPFWLKKPRETWLSDWPNGVQSALKIESQEVLYDIHPFGNGEIVKDVTANGNLLDTSKDVKKWDFGNIVIFDKIDECGDTDCHSPQVWWRENNGATGFLAEVFQVLVASRVNAVQTAAAAASK